MRPLTVWPWWRQRGEGLVNRREAIAVIVGSATVAATAPVLGDIVREQQIAGDIFQVPCGPDGNKHVRLWATREGVVVMHRRTMVTGGMA